MTMKTVKVDFWQGIKVSRKARAVSASRAFPNVEAASPQPQQPRDRLHHCTKGIRDLGQKFQMVDSIYSKHYLGSIRGRKKAHK